MNLQQVPIHVQSLIASGRSYTTHRPVSSPPTTSARLSRRIDQSLVVPETANALLVDYAVTVEVRKRLGELNHRVVGHSPDLDFVEIGQAFSEHVLVPGNSTLASKAALDAEPIQAAVKAGDSIFARQWRQFS